MSENSFEMLDFYMPFEGEKVFGIIDGSNFFTTLQMLDSSHRFDFKLFKEILSMNCRLMRLNYYTATMSDENGHDPLRRLTDFLAYNGYNVVTKEGKQYTQSDGVVKKKGNMDVEMTVDMMTSMSFVDHYLLATGDGDFVEAVKAVQRSGKKVTLLSSIETHSPICSEELRKQCDRFVDLANLIDVGGNNGEHN